MPMWWSTVVQEQKVRPTIGTTFSLAFILHLPRARDKGDREASRSLIRCQ